LLDLLSQLQQRTLVMSLHDINLAARYCTHALLLFGNGECCGGPIEQMLDTEILSRLYGHKVGSGETVAGRFYFPA
jgi:iron complex transport system ATP-binding protein